MASEPPAAPSVPTPIPAGSLAAGRRITEAIVIGLVGSTSLYLVGSVYVAAYFGRLSIDAASLDLAPPFVALQATHAAQGLLNFPLTVAFLVLLARLFARPARWLRRGYAAAAQRFGRAVLLLANLALVIPLLAPAVQAAFDLDNLVLTGTVLNEAAELLVTVGILLVGYVIWLSLGPRLLLLTALRQWRWGALGLVFVAYLLQALITTAQAGEVAAEALLLGQADDALALVVTPRPGVPQRLPPGPLLLVIERNGFLYAVAQQTPPASGRPLAYQIPADGLSLVTTQRLHAARPQIEASEVELTASPAAR
jgi:hypothetical protein